MRSTNGLPGPEVDGCASYRVKIGPFVRCALQARPLKPKQNVEYVEYFECPDFDKDEGFQKKFVEFGTVTFRSRTRENLPQQPLRGALVLKYSTSPSCLTTKNDTMYPRYLILTRWC
jgi:hypothetical protein